jgi:hypothetical protein
MCASKNSKPKGKTQKSKIIKTKDIIEGPYAIDDYDPRLAMDTGIEYENEEEFLKKYVEICVRDGVNLKPTPLMIKDKNLSLNEKIDIINEENTNFQLSTKSIDKLKLKLLKYKKELKDYKQQSEKKIEQLSQEKEMLASKLLKELAQNFFINMAQISNQQVINNIQINPPPSPPNPIEISSLQPPKQGNIVHDEPIERIRRIPPKVIQTTPAQAMRGNYSLVVSELETVLQEGNGLKPIDPKILEERKKWKEERLKNVRKARLKMHN